MQRGRDHHDRDRAARADLVAEQPGDHRAEEAAEEEDVDPDEGDAAGPEPVRDDRREGRDDHRERPTAASAVPIATKITEQDDVRHEHADGDEHAERRR